MKAFKLYHIHHFKTPPLKYVQSEIGSLMCWNTRTHGSLSQVTYPFEPSCFLSTRHGLSSFCPRSRGLSIDNRDVSPHKSYDRSASETIRRISIRIDPVPNLEEIREASEWHEQIQQGDPVFSSRFGETSGPGRCVSIFIGWDGMNRIPRSE